MNRLGAVAAVFLAAGLGVGGWNLTHGTARAATDCAVRTAWSGTESTVQQNGDLLERFPVDEPIEVRRITVSGSFAAPAGSSGFAEELMLVGTSNVPVAWTSDLVPVTQADPVFGPSQVSTTGAPWSGQTALQSGVLAAQIVKTTTLDGAFDRTVTPLTPVSVAAGGQVWLFVGTIGDQPLDPESQLVVDYTPAGCL